MERLPPAEGRPASQARPGTLPDAPIDYLLVGHVTVDLTPTGPATGGTATYSGLTARALGLSTGLVTATANGELPPALAGIPAACLPSKQSSTFENVYDHGERTQWIRGVAAPLGLSAIPAGWRAAPIVHLGPVAQEVDSSLATAFPNSFVGLTPQGWLRAWDGEGRVRAAPWPNAEATLRAASAVVIGQDDVGRDGATIAAFARAARVLVVTAAAEGATVYRGGEVRHFPAPVVEEVDPTGAGDIFATVFFARLHATGDPWESARAAVALASASVTRAGLASIPTAAEVRAILHPR